TTIEACNFVGKLLTTNANVAIGGGFVAENNGTLTISKSLYAPATVETGETEPSAEGTATFSRNNGEGTSNFTNSYYTKTLGTAQGKQGYTVTAEAGITVALAENSTNGLTYDGTIYAGESDVVSLTLSGGNTPENGYTFKGYKASAGTLTESEGKYSLTMPGENVVISAEFAQLYSVTISDSITNGTVTANFTQAVEGETITLTVTPATGYSVASVKYNGAAITAGEDGEYQFTMPAENVTVTAEFEAVDYSVGGITDGSMTVDKQTAHYGDIVTLTPARGYKAENVTVKNGENDVAVTKNDDGTYTFTMPAGAVTVDFNIEAIPYAITYDLDGGSLPEGQSNPETYTIDSNEIKLINPARSGYTFTGWTGSNGETPETSVTIPTDSTGDRTYTANWEKSGSPSPDPDAPEFKTYQLILGSKIGVVLYVDIPEDFRDNAYMRFTVNGVETTQDFDEDFKNETGKYYGFEREITSVQMADTITAELHYNDGAEEKTVTYECSAKGYLDYGLANETDTATLELLKAIADYGHYVQQPLATENGWQVGVQHAAMTSATEESVFDGYVTALAASDDLKACAIKVGSETSGIDVKYALDLTSETQINVYFEVPEGMSLSANIGSGGEAQVIENGRYKVNIAGISAHLLGKTYTITVHPYEGETARPIFTVEVSALSYVNTVLSSAIPSADDDDGKALSKNTALRRGVTSLYRYYKATKSYRSAKGYND
ncbi:MAG: InlB B-repeat-containing protein, partial [Synergistaceae bacterium]|nr:InlB B-repeat-containing protein [Synergistaceae bacterium]